MAKKRKSYFPGERLRKFVQESGSIQRDFAKSVGLSLSGLTTILRGKSPVSRTLALAVEAVHGIRAEWILTGEGMRKADVRERLDAAGQAMLESAEVFDAGGRLLDDYIFRELEEDANRQATDYGRWLNKCSVQGMDIDAELDRHKQRRIEQQDLLSELWRMFRDLRAGGLSQELVRPLLLALHFRERWESVRDRSMDFRAMQSFGLQQDFEDALNRAQKILKKLDALFALDDEQRAVLENHTMKKGGEWES